jgi:Amt family ammonium transporter
MCVRCTAAIPNQNRYSSNDEGLIDTGNTAWMLAATGLVLFMTPGLAFFYGGMVRSKNTIACLMQSYVCMGIISILWVMYGYSMAFGDTVSGMLHVLCWITHRHVSCLSGFYGNPSTYPFYKDVGATPNSILAPGIPHTIFASFQLMFAMITPALVSGAFAERGTFIAGSRGQRVKLVMQSTLLVGSRGLCFSTRLFTVLWHTWYGILTVSSASGTLTTLREVREFVTEGIH